MNHMEKQCPVGHNNKHCSGSEVYPEGYRNGKIDPHDLEMVAYWSDSKVRARNAIFQVDSEMRRNYADLKAELIDHLTPVIVVNNDPKGGEYTLIYKGKIETLQPVSEIFEMAKSIAHVPLGIFSIIAPYLKGSDTDAWIAKLEEFSNTLRTARAELKSSEIPEELERSCARILDSGIRFIEKSVDMGYVSIRSFEMFSGSVYDCIRTNMWYASEAQITGVSKTMKRWRKKVGDQHWQDLYVVVLSIWTTSVLNQNSIIVREFMDSRAVDTHLIDIPTAETPDDYLYVALDNLARIVQDNVAAEMVFPTDQEIADALKGTEDLLSDTIIQQLHCPFQGERYPAGSNGSSCSQGGDELVRSSR